MAIKHFKTAEFDAAVEAAPLAMVDFWASWCGPCKMLSPTVEAIGEQYEGRVLVGKVNVDEEPELARRLVDFLTDDVTAREWCAIGRIPACRVPDEWLGAFPQASREAYAILLKGVGMQPYYDQYLPAALTVVHKNTTRDLFAGRLTPQQAAERMRDEAKK